MIAVEKKNGKAWDKQRYLFMNSPKIPKVQPLLAFWYNKIEYLFPISCYKFEVTV